MSGNNDKRASEKSSDEKDKKGGHPLLSIIGAAVSVAVLVFSINMAMNYKEIFARAMMSLPFSSVNLTTLATVKSPDSSNTKFFAAGGRLFSAAQNKLRCYDKYGAIVWEKDFVSSNPYVSALSSDFAMADMNIGDLYVVSKDGEIKAKKLGMGKIYGLKEKDGKLAVYLADKSKLVILDQSLKELGALTLTKDKMTSWDFCPSKRSIAVSVLGYDGQGMSTSIQISGYDGIMTESVNVDDTVVYYVRYDDDSITVLGDRRIESWAMPGAKPLWTHDFSRTTVAYDVSDDGSFVINNAGNEFNSGGINYSNSMIGVDRKGKSFSEISSLDTEPGLIRSHGSGSVMYGQGRIAAYGRDGKLKGARILSPGVIDVLNIDDGMIVVIYKDRMEVLKCLTG